MSSLPQPEGYQPEDEIVEVIDDNLPPQLTLIEGELETQNSPPENYRHDWLRAQAALTDQGAFEELYREFYGLIRLKASSYFLQGGDTKDLIQEGALGLYKGIRDYDGQQSSLRNFLDTCITRQIITAVKTATRKKHGPLNQYVSFDSKPKGVEPEVDVTIGDMLSDHSPSPQDAVVDREELWGLVAIMSTELSTLESNVLGLFMNGVSYEVIANNLGTNTKSVDNALQRARLKLERHLQTGDDPTLVTKKRSPKAPNIEKVLSQEQAKLGYIFDHWLNNVYSQPGNGLSEAVSSLKSRPEASDAVIRETRGYLALIARDSDWPSPLSAYREACRAVRHRAEELSTASKLSEVFVTDSLIEAALNAVKDGEGNGRPIN